VRKTVLIIGGLGYLGGRIAQSLLTTNKYKIIIGTRSNQVVLPKQLVGCDVALIDLLEKNSIRKSLKGVDIIIHLAAMNANECAKNPSDALLVNGLGTLNLVQSVKDSGVKKIIYFSTAHVYGSPLLGNISEDTLVTPSNHYAITHRIAEDYIIKVGREGKISTTIVRLSNAIGRPINKHTNCWMLVANDIAKQIVEKNKIYINSSGKQLRDFIPISNIISAVIFLLESHNSYGEVFNLGSGVSLSILDLAKLLSTRAKAILDVDVSVTTGIDKIDPNDYFSYKIDKITSLGYSPTCSLEDEIDNLLMYVNKEFKTKDVYE
jgi:UDP-glucose 4-epimerase